MISSAVFMNRLRRIIADAACDDATSRALNMFRSYKRDLYEEFDIRSANRLTRSVKSQVNDLLAELRLEVLRAEFEAPEPSPMRTICAAVRWDIDMARRSLALRQECMERETSVPPVPPSVFRRGRDGEWLQRLRLVQSIEVTSRSRRLITRLRRSPSY
jgi:hypothetical protein